VSVQTNAILHSHCICQSSLRKMSEVGADGHPVDPKNNHAW